MNWRVNKDEALEGFIDGKCVAGIWRGASKDDSGRRLYGFLAATWHPYKRLGWFADVKAAKRAVEA